MSKGLIAILLSHYLDYGIKVEGQLLTITCMWVNKLKVFVGCTETSTTRNNQQMMQFQLRIVAFLKII